MTKSTESLLFALQEHGKSGTVPFHMPGHKRNAALAPYLNTLNADLDITEIPNFDDLHDPQGILKNGQARCAALYGADRSFFLINGSTAGLLAGIRAATRYGDTVIMSRTAHKAIYHAIELCGLRPVFLLPDTIEGFGCAASIRPQQVADALAAHPEAGLVILTSPTFDGVVSDIEGICAIAQGRNVPVLVDEAHGAHFGLSPHFPKSAIQLGADLVIQSFHKTLPSLTQTAVLHGRGGLVSMDEVQRQLGIFQSSSPSYLLLASLDSCVSLLESRGAALFDAWHARLSRFYATVSALCQLRLLSKETDPVGIFDFDRSKIVLSTARSSYSGVSLMEGLRLDYHIQLEMALEEYATAMTGMGDTDGGLYALAQALLSLGAAAKPRTEKPSSLAPLPLPQQVHTPAQAADMAWELIPIGESCGRISAESIWAYPPGIPLVIPGEEISAALLSRVSSLVTSGIKCIGTRGQPAERIAVLL